MSGKNRFEIQTIAGTGEGGFSGDGGHALNAQIREPFGVVVGPDDAIYFCDLGNHRIRRIERRTGNISTVVGSGECGNAGDGGIALEAALSQPYEIRFDQDGNLVFVDMAANVIRRVDRSTKIIETLAGTGEAGFSGDGGHARDARFDQPHSIEFDTNGVLYICDIRNHRIRSINPQTGTIQTYAGTGEQAPTPNGAPLTGTPLNGPRAMAFDQENNMYLALREGNVVLKLDRKTKEFNCIAGTGEKGYCAYPEDARSARLSGPKGIALGPGTALYIADTESHTIRRIDLESSVITTVIGLGEVADGANADPLMCGLARPHGVFVDGAERIYVGDSENHQVRMLTRV